MQAVAYCRVSTNKEEQIDSLQAQQEFFTEYAKRHNHELIEIYADEGKSGTKMKHRVALIQMLCDAERGEFQMVLIKDVSRLARNTVDFLTSIRKLKSAGIEVIFVNYDMTTSDSSEFMLTMLSAIAQEESSNTSKRIKFGKKINAEKGRIPNLCYGYEKTKGDYFQLAINPEEAAIIQNIFHMYIHEGLGSSRIAKQLNAQGALTKRLLPFSQHSISRILTNEIYIGKVVNGKECIEDFLTGKRLSQPEDAWSITCNESLRIIDDETFFKAQRVMKDRQNTFHQTGEKKSSKHPFSKVIYCACCGYAYRQIVRKYKRTYVRWCCSGRNTKGTDFCHNTVNLDEQFLLSTIKSKLLEMLQSQQNALFLIKTEYQKCMKTTKRDATNILTLKKERDLFKHHMRKYKEMFKANIIELNELQLETTRLQDKIDVLDCRIANHATCSKPPLLSLLDHTSACDGLESILTLMPFSNQFICELVENITVDHDGAVCINFKQLKH